MPKGDLVRDPAQYTAMRSLVLVYHQTSRWASSFNMSFLPFPCNWRCVVWRRETFGHLLRFPALSGRQSGVPWRQLSDMNVRVLNPELVPTPALGRS